jgi:hypothetical protein
MKRTLFNSLPRRLGILGLIALIAATAAIVRAQELIEYPAPVEEEFPAGYDVYDTNGKLLKTVPGPTRAKVQAYFEQQGRRLYLSDWSYERFRKQGGRPNLMVAREVARPAMKEKTVRATGSEGLNESGSKIAPSSRRDLSDSVVEGFNYSGGRWAYEFIVHPIEPTLDLATDSTGMIVFADSEFVVRAMQLQGSWIEGSSHEKTELSFYNAKTCRLVSIISVPNRVFTVGKLGRLDEDRFYIGTITPSKYRYDDCPLAITLAELSSRSIEAIPLVAEDYWFALGHGVKVEAIADSGSEEIRITVERGTGPKYEKFQPQKKAFLKTRIRITEGLSVSKEGERWADRTSDEQRHRRLAAGKESGLGDLGVHPLRSGSSRNSDRFAFGSSDAIGSGLVVARAAGNGKLIRFDLGKLKRTMELSSPGAVSLPFVLPNGSVACVADGELHLIGNEARRVVKFPGNEKPLLVFPTKHKKLGASSLDLIGGTFRYSDGARFWRLDPPEGVDFSPVTSGSQVVRKLGPEGRILDWDPATRTLVVSVRNFDRPYQRIRESTGEAFGVGWDGGGKQVYLGITQSNAVNGWRALSFVNDATTGGISSAVTLENAADGSGSIHIANGLTENADPLALIDAGRKLRTVFGAGDKVQFVEVDPATGAVESIKIWNFASRFGEALFDASSGLLLIPGASGFEAWKLSGEGDPTKEFDLVLADDDTFAVLLPNGLYAGSPGCEKLLRFGSIDGASVAAWRNRPAEVLKALGGDASEVEILAQVTDRWLAKIGNPERNPEPASGDFPTLALSSDVPLWAESGEVVLAFDIKAGASPVKDLVVRVNGVDAQRGSNAVAPSDTVERRVKIAEGQNWIEAVAIDEQGRASNRVRFRTILGKSEKPSRRFIVAMGVSVYRNGDLDLDFAAKDALDLSRAIRDAYPGDSEVLLLTNEAVTRDAPEKIREFLAAATENDEVVAFGAVHGVLDANLDYYFCSHEFDPVDPARTCIRFDDLVDALCSTRALKRLLLLDTCHSGKVGEKDELLLAEMNAALPEGVRMVRAAAPAIDTPNGLKATQQRRFIEDMFLMPGLQRGLTIIGASAGSQFALESPEWNNGVFTASILEGLLGEKADFDSDGRVGVGELRDYSGTRVTELTRGAQTPIVVSFEDDQDFDLIKRPVAAFPEMLIHDFYDAIASRDENAIARRLSDTVDYFKSGKISRKSVMHDIIGDWKRYDEERYQISNFAKTETSSFRFLMTYRLSEGNRPKGGTLQMEATLSGRDAPRISALKAKVISTW